MAKSDNNNTFGDFAKKVKLSPDRQNLKPRPKGLTEEEYLYLAIEEGHQLLEEDKKNSVKAPAPVKPSVVQDALAKMSDNPYARARIEILKRMTPEARSVIEKMINQELPRDDKYDKFCKAVSIRGEQIYLSSNNNKNNKNN